MRAPPRTTRDPRREFDETEADVRAGAVDASTRTAGTGLSTTEWGISIVGGALGGVLVAVMLAGGQGRAASGVAIGIGAAFGAGSGFLLARQVDQDA